MDHEEKYQAFIEWLGKAPMTFPASENMIALIKVRYTPEDAELLTNVPFDPRTIEEIAEIKEQERIAREKISKLPSDLHPGVWFEIFNGDEKPVRRLKLSVILTEVAKLIFVDCHGVKVIEKDAGDFARELENRQSRFIADHSTFEHALGTVIHKLAA